MQQRFDLFRLPDMLGEFLGAAAVFPVRELLKEIQPDLNRIIRRTVFTVILPDAECLRQIECKALLREYAAVLVFRIQVE